jgi:hypothetical protein
MCAHSTSLPVQVADSSPTLFSDMSQFARLNGTPTVAKSSGSEPQKDGFPVCMCSRETFGCSLHPTGKEKWIASMRDSLARTFRSLEEGQEWGKEQDLGFTEKSCVALMKYDQSSCSWKMFQRSLAMDLVTFSETWPSAGMIADGVVYVHPMSAPRTGEKDGLLWPTLTASPRGATTAERNAKRLGGVSLESALARWESPTNRTDGPGVHGGLNPNFLEWFMGFPIGWTEKKRSETRKSRCKRPSRLKS